MNLFGDVAFIDDQKVRFGYSGAGYSGRRIGVQGDLRSNSRKSAGKTERLLVSIFASMADQAATR